MTPTGPPSGDRPTRRGATGGHTELGRIAALSQRTRRRPSPLELQVKRVAWLIAAVAVGMGAVFLVLAALVGLPLADALMFAIGLLVANVPGGCSRPSRSPSQSEYGCSPARARWSNGSARWRRWVRPTWSAPTRPAL